MNFFKHANRDPDSNMPFDPSLTEPFILISLYILEDAGAQLTPEEMMFRLWGTAHNPEWFDAHFGQDRFAQGIHIEALAKLRHVPKQRFQRMCQFLIRQTALGK